MSFRSFIFLVILLPFTPAAQAERPFFTDEAETLRPGDFTVDAGFALREDPKDFGIEPRDRQWELGDIRLSFGLGKFAELQVSGVAVSLIENEGSSTTDSGDWIFGTKIWMFQEKGMRPALSFLYEVKLPNGSKEDGGATDETDFFGYLVSSKSLGKKDLLHGNLGLGILGNPFANSKQNDIFILRLAWEHKLGERQLFGLEAIAEGGPSNRDDVFLIRAAYARNLGPLVVHGGVGVGLNEDSDDFRVDLGVRKALKLWHPKEPVRRNSW